MSYLQVRGSVVFFFLPSRKACSGIHETQTAFKASTQTQHRHQSLNKKEKSLLHVTVKDATTSWGDVRKGRGGVFCNVEEEKNDWCHCGFCFPLHPFLILPFSRADVAGASSQGTETLNLTVPHPGFSFGLFCFKSHDLTATCDLCITAVTPPGNKEIRSSQRPVYHRKALAKGGL